MRLVRLERVGSTMGEAHALAAEGAPHGTAVCAREQEGGYGTRGRVWHSPVGGLWLSVILRPTRHAQAEGLSVRIGLAVAAALEEEVPHLRIGLKWPNDLMLENRKLGGVLCEARWQGDQLGWVVAGVGINVMNPVPESLHDLAATLREVAIVDPADLAGPVVRRVAEATRAGGALTQRELAAFEGRDWLRGRTVAAPGASGAARGITAEGALRIETATGVHEVIGAGVALAG